MDNYVDAIIRIKVPKWQIGEEVKIYFKDTMYISGICEKEDKEKINENIYNNRIRRRRL